MKNFLFTGNCCIFVNLGWRTLPTQIKRKVQIFFKVVLLLCPYTAPDKFKDCFSVLKFFLVWTGLNIARICKKLGYNQALNLIHKNLKKLSQNLTIFVLCTEPC